MHLSLRKPIGFGKTGMTFELRKSYAAETENTKEIAAVLKQLLGGREPIVMCVGTEFVTGDSLGPCVGSYIMEKMTFPVFVYGSQGSNVNALNLQLAANMIKTLHPDNPLIVVDAAVGGCEEVGTIYLYEGGVMPGAATNKNLPKVGDISLLGVVSQKGLDDYFMLRRTKQELVTKMAQVIADAVLMIEAS